MRARWTRAIATSVAVGATAALASTRVLAQAVPTGLSVAEVLELHRSGVSDRQILRNANSYCIAFAMSDSVAQVLTAAGAGSDLVDGLRSVCVVSPPRPPLPPGVLLDDDIATAGGLGAFVAPDGLCRATIERNGLRIVNQRRRGGCVIDYPADSIGGAVRIELSIGSVGVGNDAQVVLGFGRSGAAWNQYTFSVTAGGRVELCRASASECKTLASRTVRGLVRTGPGAENSLVVEAREASIALYVNDERVGDYLPDGPVGGTIVLGVGPSSDVRFRHLRVRALDATAAR